MQEHIQVTSDHHSQTENYRRIRSIFFVNYRRIRSIFCVERVAAKLKGQFARRCESRALRRVDF